MNRMDSMIDRFIVWVRDHPKTRKIPIGPNPEDPTYWRYFVIPRNPVFNIYLHNFRHDDAENMHDHRMVNISILLQGHYNEERFSWTPEVGYPLPCIYLRQVGRFVFRLPSTPHRVILNKNYEGRSIPMWSLFIGFPHVRDWGFWIEEIKGDYQVAKWISHKKFVSAIDPTSVGYGQKR